MMNYPIIIIGTKKNHSEYNINNRVKVCITERNHGSFEGSGSQLRAGGWLALYLVGWWSWCIHMGMCSRELWVFFCFFFIILTYMYTAPCVVWPSQCCQCTGSVLWITPPQYHYPTLFSSWWQAVAMEPRKLLWAAYCRYLQVLIKIPGI